MLHPDGLQIKYIRVAENVRPISLFLLPLSPADPFPDSAFDSSSTKSRSKRRSSDGAATRDEAGLVVDEEEGWVGEAEWADEVVSPILPPEPCWLRRCLHGVAARGRRLDGTY